MKDNWFLITSPNTILMDEYYYSTTTTTIINNNNSCVDIIHLIVDTGTVYLNTWLVVV